MEKLEILLIIKLASEGFSLTEEQRTKFKLFIMEEN